MTKLIGYVKGYAVRYDEKNGTMYIKGTTIQTHNLKSIEEAIERAEAYEGFKPVKK